MSGLTRHSTEYRRRCAAVFALSFLGRRWRVPILWTLREKPLRHAELRRALGNVTQFMLTKSLRELENFGLVSRAVTGDVPPQVSYELTEKARAVIPILAALSAWGEEISETFPSDAARGRVRRGNAFRSHGKAGTLPR